MFPQFGATADTLSKASTMVFRIGTDAHLYDDPEDVNIAPLLDSKFDSEKCEALKRLLALIAQGFDVPNFFPQVVKNVASQSLEVKKLVYLYLLHYAEKRPNEALLSINCFQKDLGDPNPLVRAWALRAMAGIRLHVISPIVLVAVGKCARDPSVYVRKCAANALPKLYDLHLEENTATIEEIVGILLNDNSPGVVGAAAAAFASVCPNNLSLIERNYRRLCETLPDVEEWGQIVLIGILLRYVIARHGLAKESIMLSSCATVSYRCENDGSDTNFELKDNGNDKGCDVYESELPEIISRSYLEGPEKYLSRSSNADKGSFGLDYSFFTSAKNNYDVKILLQCTSPLLWSHNSAVVLAAAGVHWIMAPKEDVKRIVKPLLFVLRSSNASKYVVLCNIQVFAKAMPCVFSPYYEDFFIYSSDSYQIKALKLEILSSIATDASISVIFQEFQDYVRDPDRRFAADTVAAIGLCARRLPKVADMCLEGLLALTRQESLNSDIGSVGGEDGVLVQALISIKAIINLDPPRHEKVIVQLVRSLELIKVPTARAMIFWMVGEYNSIGGIIPMMLPTVLKYLAWCFTSEALEAKLQILNTAVKVLLSSKGEETWTFRRILSYVLELAIRDLSYDVRDRARALKKLLSSLIVSHDLEEEAKGLPENKDLKTVVADFLFRGQSKPCPEPINYRFYLPGSLSQIVLHAAPGYEPLPNPCSLSIDELGHDSNDVQGIKALREGPTSSDSYGVDGSDTVSGSLDGGNTSDYSSEYSITGSGGDEESGSASGRDDNADPLINFSDVSNACATQNGRSQDNNTPSRFDDFEELMSKEALDSWLDEHPSQSSSELSHVQRSSARISIGDMGGRVRLKSHKLLDPAIGNGLSVDYTFSSEISSVSPLLVCVEVSFTNCSTEAMSKLLLLDEESSKGLNSTEEALAISKSPLTSDKDVPTLVPMEDINSLDAGQTIKRVLQVRFHHHLLPLKLVLWCNGKKHPVKLRPDIGYFVKPLPMNIEMFTSKESQLPGMFEYKRSCTFTDHIGELKNEKGDSSLIKDKFLVLCESLALKMLCNANLFLVSVDLPVAANLDDASGLRLRFSSEILSNSIPCLITVTIEGKCFEPLTVSVKVNCEETVFGLNLLNRIVNFIAEPILTTS
ncbi:AP3-complex subunit beta-A-like isoform X1 [Actinidia eriantha]|uniref:AP3-complex subunit beta-A-like isoform X1 n=2 Tax=Actinidia eriantha TaxID=165200 RepID=UPI0025910B24|nr:AP3-complex subunit beta-A-like isoform X1 [Actinidia eriantha]